jgi:pimeloyl-ACP methyl ester carboxylesterase
MLHYTSNGLGSTIVLIHGFCENSTCFNEQVFLLKDHYTIITIDLPGHGQSPVIPSFSMNDLADEINRVLEAEGVNQCVLIGHSMGGYAALAFAKKFGNKLAGFGLMHSTANADSDERKAKRDQAIAVVTEKGAEIYVHNFIPPLFAANTPNELIAGRQASNDNITAETLVACLTAMKNREDSSMFIIETNLPAAFFVGKQDMIIPEKDMLAQAVSAKVAKVVYLENAAHMGMLEIPAEVADGMKAFADFCFENKNLR